MRSFGAWRYELPCHEDRTVSPGLASGQICISDPAGPVPSLRVLVEMFRHERGMVCDAGDAGLRSSRPRCFDAAAGMHACTHGLRT
jgi:hypothetical protein